MTPSERTQDEPNTPWDDVRLAHFHAARVPSEAEVLDAMGIPALLPANAMPLGEP